MPYMKQNEAVIVITNCLCTHSSIIETHSLEHHEHMDYMLFISEYLSHTPHCSEGVRILFMNRPSAIQVW